MAVANPFLGGFVFEFPPVPKRISRFRQPFGIIPKRLNLLERFLLFLIQIYGHITS